MIDIHFDENTVKFHLMSVDSVQSGLFSRSQQQAGKMILSDEGGDFGKVLRSLHSYVLEFRRADVAKGSGSALEHLLVASCLD